MRFTSGQSPVVCVGPAAGSQKPGSTAGQYMQTSISRRPLWAILTVPLLAALGAFSCSPSESNGPSEPEGPYRQNAGICETDADCAAEAGATVCDVASGCVECLFDSQCGSGEKCARRTCVEVVTCQSDSECEGSGFPICDANDRVCVSCAIDAHCGENARCLDGACSAATACVNSRDCETDAVCDRDSGWCVECLADSDCEEESLCVTGTCKASCDSDKDCLSDRLLCDASARYCVECVEDVDCPDAYHCDAGSCDVDICQTGDARCEDSTNALLTCNASGSAMVPVFCPTRTTCSERDQEARCQPWTCEPGAVSCDSEGKMLRVCQPDGISTEDTDCTSMDGVCEGAACVDVVCEPGELKCVNGNSFRCNTTGTVMLVDTLCGYDRYCAEETGECTQKKCDENQLSCDGEQVRKCNANGSGFLEEIEEDCGATSGDTCHEGACETVICEDGSRYCDSGSVYQCSEAGTKKALWDTCSYSEYCDDSTGSALCRSKVCTAGSSVCIGGVAGVCDAKGSGLLPGGVDCAAADDESICHLGSCKPIVCPGIYGCEDGNSKYCSASGTAFGSVRDTCSSSEHCVEDQWSCKADVCAQGAAGCDGNRPAVCNADGSAWESSGTPCASDEACVSGACLPVICTPYSRFCDGGNAFYCGSNGTTSSLADTCTAAEYCSESGYCYLDKCTAGEATCAGENVSTCAADGSGAADAGTPCASGNTCFEGSCAPVICTPDAYRCSANVGQRCNSTGTKWDTYRTCSSESTFCDASGAYPVCSSDICAAGQASCSGETPATCDAYGGGYVNLGTDCSLTSQVCTGTSCAVSHVLTLGGSLNSYGPYSSRAHYNRFQMTSSRTLTEIEQYISGFVGTYQFRFLVLETTANSNYMSLVLDKVVTSSTTGMIKSGTIDVALEAGKYYAIGVYVTGNHTAHYTTETMPQFESLGVFRGGSSNTPIPSGASNYVGSVTTRAYYQNLTTEAAD